jgi:hypothetical protein
VTTKAGLFNNCLVELGHRPLEDTGEAVEAGRLLNQVYSQVTAECLSAGSWNFAMEDASLTGDTGLISDRVGFRYGFSKPTDWVRTIGVSLDEYFSVPLIDYYDDADIWKADSTPIYVRYVSNDTGLGLDLAKWPAMFTRYVELELASRVGFKITASDSTMERVEAKRDKARTRALNVDAMNEAQPKFAPPGSWTTARWGRGGGDRGSRGSLTG